MTILTRRQRERQKRRTSILDAADAVFANKGFDQATMDDIAAAAELSKGTLYLYFKSKDDLFIALVSRSIEDMVEAFESIVHQAPSGILAIRSMLEGYAENVLRQPQLFRIMVGQLASGRLIDPEIASFKTHRALVERLIAAFVAAIERGKSDASIRADVDPQQVSSQLWGGLLGTMLIRINSTEMARRFQPSVDYNKFADGYIQLVCHGLQPTTIQTSQDARGESGMTEETP